MLKRGQLLIRQPSAAPDKTQKTPVLCEMTFEWEKRKTKY